MSTTSVVTINNGPAGGPNVVTGTITPVFTWLGMFGPPPTSLDIVVTASANAGGYTVNAAVNNGTVSASDGLNDAPTGNGITGSASTGKALFHKDNTQHATVLTFPAISLNVTASSTGSTFCAVSLKADLDSRNVAIQSSLDPTFRRGSVTGQIVQNTPAINGAMFADTVAPDASSTTSTNYKPVYAPSAWGTGSQYSWKFSANPSIFLGPVSGTFNTIFYDVSAPVMTYANPPITPGTTDTVTLKLTDSKDGASATNTYSVLFHAPYELWKDGPVVRHPVALVKGGINDTHPDWTYLTSISNGGSQNMVQNLTSAVSLATTESGTIGSQQTLTPAGIAAFQLNESITVGKTDTYTYTVQNTFTGGPHALTQFFSAMTYENRIGTADNFALHGYQGNFAWQGVWTSGVVSPGSIEWPN